MLERQEITRRTQRRAGNPLTLFGWVALISGVVLAALILAVTIWGPHV